MKKYLLPLFSRSVVITLLALGLTTVAFAAWSGPPAGTPPNNCTSGTAGCDAPVNVGSSAQIKNGGFGTLNGAVSTHNGLLFDNLSSDPPLTTYNLYVKNGNLYFGSSQLNLGGGGTIGGTGATNVVAKFTGASTLGPSLIYDNGTNVGIGTVNPTIKFQVGDQSVGGSDGQIAIGKNNGGARMAVLKYDSSYNFGIFDEGTTRQLSVAYNAPADSFYINSGGNVGLGTASPGYKLDVGGQGSNASSRLGTMIIATADSGYEWWIGPYTTPGYWQLTHRNNTDGSWTNALTVTTANTVGIGTYTPKNQLTINSNWGGYQSPEALSIKGTYPSMTFRSSTTGGVWLMHMAGDNTLNWYGATDGIDSVNWTRRMWLTPTGELNVQSANGAYSYIVLHDDESPNGVKSIHANSNVLGFLNGNGGWMSYWADDGTQRNTGPVYAQGQPLCEQNGVNCPGGATGWPFGGMFWRSQNGGSVSYSVNPLSGYAGCPGGYVTLQIDGMRDGNNTLWSMMFCAK